MKPTLGLLIAGLLIAGTGPDAAAQTNAYAFVPHTGDDQTVVVDVAARAALPGTLTTLSGASSATASPDGRLVYVTGPGFPEIAVIDVATRTVSGHIPLTFTPAFATAFSPDGQTAYVTSPGWGSVMKIDVAAGAVVGSSTLGASPRMIQVTPDGTKAYVTSDVGVHRLDLATLTQDAFLPVAPTLHGLAITPDGQAALAVSNTLAQVIVIDLPTLTPVSSIAVGASPLDIAVSPDGLRAYVTNSGDSSVSVIDVVTRTVLATVPVGLGPAGIQVTPDGRQVFVVNQTEGTVTVLDAATNTAVGPPIPSGGASGFGARFITPNLIVPAGGPLDVADDFALGTAGFGQFVPFLGGTMRVTAGFGTLRTFSLLAPGGTLDTNGFTASLIGGLVGPGTLTKTGAGGLGLSGPISHGGTVLSDGGLYVMGPHPSPLSMTGGYLYVQAPLGDITATGGTILYGGSGAGTVQAAAVTLGSGVTLYLDLLGPDGPGAANGHDQLQAASAALNGATLEAQPAFTPAIGTSFVIATNATGEFAGLPEGARIMRSTFQWAILYVGGDGNDVTLTCVNTPPFISFPSSNWFTHENTPAAPIDFLIGDFDGNTNLSVTATSSDEAIVPASGIVLEDKGTHWTLGLTPRFGARGLVTISVTVSDGADSTTATIALTVAGGTYLVSEGATGPFFDTDILIVNPNPTEAPISIHYLKPAGAPIVQTRTLAPMSRTTIAVDEIAGLEDASFSTVVTSHTFGLSLVVERTMRWGQGGYGAHTEKSAEWGVAPTWFFAEGAQGFFSTFFLLSNPEQVANTAHVYFLREGQPVVQRDYPLAPGARFTLDAGTVEELQNTAFGTVVDFDRPAAAERSMYFGEQPFWSGGTASAGTIFPAPSWFFAEGATGSYFTTFLLLANPNPVPADVTIRYLPSTGVPVTRTFTIPPLQRVTRNIATEDASLENAAVAAEVTSSELIVAERAQYWGAGTWIDGHASAGDFSPERKWGLAEGRVGGADNTQTYILLANPGTLAATVTVTFIRESGGTLVKTFTVPPASRFNVGVAGPGSRVPELTDERFGALIESTQPISVERSMYSDAGGVTWAAGTNATATFIP